MWVGFQHPQRGTKHVGSGWADLWDEEEYYWAADEAADACESAGLQVTYKQVSSCGGVFVMEPVGSG